MATDSNRTHGWLVADVRHATQEHTDAREVERLALRTRDATIRSAFVAGIPRAQIAQAAGIAVAMVYKIVAAANRPPNTQR
jgi:hypothetical protein